jgi:hypothetical protein
MIPIIDELFNYPINLVTTAPEWLIRTSLTKFRYRRLTITPLLTDPGCVQSDPFTIDLPATIQAWQTSIANHESLVKSEVARLQKLGRVRLIISDISYIGQLVAESLKVPSVCVATFDWSFIYQSYRSDNPEFNAILERIESISSRFDDCLIPGEECHPLKIGKKQHHFKWCSRKQRTTRTDIRDKLGLTIHQDSVLISFGGHAIKRLPQDVWERFSNYEFFVLVPTAELEKPPAENVHFLSSEQWSKYHVDLVDSVDVVMGRFGYGLVSEILHTKSKFLVVERKGNPEGEVLSKWVAPVVPMRQITHQQFLEGDWYALNEVIEIERDPEEFADIVTDGEKEVAKWIRQKLGDGEPRVINPRWIKWGIAVFVVLLIWFFLRRGK